MYVLDTTMQIAEEIYLVHHEAGKIAMAASVVVVRGAGAYPFAGLAHQSGAINPKNISSLERSFVGLL